MFSVLIEIIQYVMGFCITEIDDVFGNTLGGWSGVWVAYVGNAKVMRCMVWAFRLAIITSLRM